MKLFKKILRIMASIAIAFTAVKLPSATKQVDAAIQARQYRCYNMNTQQTTTYWLPVAPTLPDNSDGIVSGQPNGNFTLSTDSRLIRCAGTGFIVGEHIIATNAHCIYNATNDTFGTNGYVTAFEFPNGTPVPHNLTVVSLHVPVDYREKQGNGTYAGNGDFDYGLIEVQEDLSNYGCFNLGLPLDALPTESNNGTGNGKAVTVSGFPQAVINTPDGYRYSPVQSTGNVYSMSTYRINHTADTLNGSSGSPIYTTTSYWGVSYDTVIGIHNAAVNGTYNGGVRITQPLLTFYCSNPYVS